VDSEGDSDDTVGTGISRIVGGAANAFGGLVEDGFNAFGDVMDGFLGDGANFGNM
jgi:hypothetical protein